MRKFGIVMDYPLVSTMDTGVQLITIVSGIRNRLFGLWIMWGPGDNAPVVALRRVHQQERLFSSVASLSINLSL
jgi:hypothetical protein